MNFARRVPIAEASATARARRLAATEAAKLGLEEHDRARAALVAVEAGTNLLRHAGGGEILLLPIEPRGLRILALDTGPGFDARVARRDGYSTSGGAGTGLGAMARASDTFSIYSEPAKGTVLMAEIYAAGAPPPRSSCPPLAGLSVPHPGEEVCGDGWAAASDGGGVTSVVLLDGLGHGEAAADASHTGIEGFEADPHLPPHEQLARLHELLRPTRGAAAGVARLDGRRQRLDFAGVGNTLGMIDAGSDVRHLVSHNGTVGHEMARVQEFSYPWLPGSLLVMATDGVTTRIGLARYPGLRAHHPALIAAVLYRDFRRGNDDTTVLVARQDAEARAE